MIESSVNAIDRGVAYCTLICKEGSLGQLEKCVCDLHAHLTDLVSVVKSVASSDSLGRTWSRLCLDRTKQAMNACAVFGGRLQSSPTAGTTFVSSEVTRAVFAALTRLPSNNKEAVLLEIEKQRELVDDVVIELTNAVADSETNTSSGLESELLLKVLRLMELASEMLSRLCSESIPGVADAPETHDTMDAIASLVKKMMASVDDAGSAVQCPLESESVLLSVSETANSLNELAQLISILDGNPWYLEGGQKALAVFQQVRDALPTR